MKNIYEKKDYISYSQKPYKFLVVIALSSSKESMYNTAACIILLRQGQNLLSLEAENIRESNGLEAEQMA